MRRLLLIDVGNTRVKWAGISARAAIRIFGELETAKASTPWATALKTKYHGHEVVISSVVPSVSKILGADFPSALFVQGGMRKLPLAFAYPQPAGIGADRIAAAIGVHTGPAIIISCGTATAFSVIDEKHRFCGGAIAPGLQTQLRALSGAAAQLPLTKLGAARKALGKSTDAAIRAGVLLGWQGGVREIVARLQKEVGGKARLIATGGEARHIRGVRGLGHVAFRPLLVFEGLRIIADCFSNGVDGVLILDLPPEEEVGPLGHLARISLVAPTTPPSRIAQIVRQAGGFIYYISREGVTGMQSDVGESAEGRVALIRKQTELPVCIGFGISTPDQAYTVSHQADGAVVGSALVNQIAEHGQDPALPQRLEDFARPLAEAIHAA